MNTHNLIVDFGKFKGERWTRLPISYLKWLINDGTQWANIAQAELERRGITTPTELELSCHAIDRASIQCGYYWKTTRNKGEGFYSWLYRMAAASLKDGEVAGPEKDIRIYQGMKFVFSFGEIYPTLKTIMVKD